MQIPRLITPLNEDDSSNYINASFFTAYTRNDALIVTQMPLHNTITDFWRLIYDWKSNTIVMLNDMDKDLVTGKYWSDGKAVEHGPFTVKLISIQLYDEIIERKFELINKRKMNNESHRLITQYQITDWSPEDVPRSKTVMMRLVTMIEKYQQSGDGPITVHCRNGIGRSGVFCAVVAVLERIKVEQMVDVFQAVKALRINRPGMIETVVCDIFVRTAGFKSAIW
ncbi:receptor-type tyrosine-protein phosphatase epsilon-like [Saccoglossus kowalevskii]